MTAEGAVSARLFFRGLIIFSDDVKDLQQTHAQIAYQRQQTANAYDDDTG